MDTEVSQELDINNLRAIKILGKGAMGTVFLIHHLSSDPFATAPFALKVVEKSSLHTKLDADRRARWEVSVLICLKNPPHPFLPSFPNRTIRNPRPPRVGHLVLSRRRSQRSLVQPGDYYRDLKPKNIMIQQSDHLTLTEFDLSVMNLDEEQEQLL